MISSIIALMLSQSTLFDSGKINSPGTTTLPQTTTAPKSEAPFRQILTSLPAPKSRNLHSQKVSLCVPSHRARISGQGVRLYHELIGVRNEAAGHVVQLRRLDFVLMSEISNNYIFPRRTARIITPSLATTNI